MVRIIVKNLFKILTKLVFFVKVNGKENMPKNGAAIMCANHISLLDGPTVVAYTKRKVDILGKDDLFKNKFLKWFWGKLLLHPIKRDSADLGAIKISLKLLKEGKLLMLFPEGTRNGIKKGLKPKNGAVVMAIKAGVPIIPIGIKGNFKPFRRMTINIGKPIDYGEYKDKINDKELMDKLTKELMDNIIDLTK